MILNQTTNQIISQKERLCTNLFTQSLGLMFRQRQNLIMIFKKEKLIQLHNFFVFYPTNVILLDKNRQIIEIKENFRPFTVWNSKNKAKYVIELGHENSKNNYNLDDQLVLK